MTIPIPGLLCPKEWANKALQSIKQRHSSAGGFSPKHRDAQSGEIRCSLPLAHMVTFVNMAAMRSEMISDETLTILQVLFQSDEFIERNIALTESLNPKEKILWIFVKNDQPSTWPETANQLSKISRSSLLMRPGTPAFKTPVDEGSYHHASGIQMGLEEVKTRFLLIADPDFFVLERNWISSLINHMKVNDLTFLGSCWDPANLSKYRNFPSVHFMLIDLHKAPIASLDFTPDLATTDHRRKYIEKLVQIRSKYFSGILKALGLPLMWVSLCIQRSCSRDTGFRVYERFKKFSRVECFDFLGGEHSKKMYESYRRFFPGPLVSVGKFLGILPRKIFFGINSGEIPGLEKFQRNGRLFAIHFRRVQSMSLGINQKDYYERVLNDFLQGVDLGK